MQSVVWQVEQIRPPGNPFNGDDELADPRESPMNHVNPDHLAYLPSPKKPFSGMDEFALSVDMEECDECWQFGNSAGNWERSKTMSAWSGSESTTISAHLSNPLQLARRQGKFRLLRLRGPTLLLGPIQILSGLLCAWHGRSRPMFNSLGVLLLTFGTMTLAMSLLPSDGRCVIISILLVGLPACLFVTLDAWVASDDLRMVLSGTCSFYGKDCPCWLFVVFVVSSATLILAFLAAFVVLATAMRRARATESRLKMFWKTISATCLVSSLVWAARGSACLVLGDYVEGSHFAFDALVSLISSCVSLRYEAIVSIQSWLMSRGEAATVAAGISELLGGQDPEHVLAVARTSFRSVEANRLTQVAMQQNYPDPSLTFLVRRTRLGHADAFVSHSWHDDPDLKWQELQGWCARFRALHNREPRLWIDKYCIDQNNIKESLACLPIYLSGCRHLLILCGTTYLKRLWCLMEIFVFLEMGGKLENLEVCLLQNGDAEELEQFDQKSTAMSLDSLETGLRHFDSLNACCANQDDTERLQRVIDVVGSTKINSLVSDVFLRKLIEKS